MVDMRDLTSKAEACRRMICEDLPNEWSFSKLYFVLHETIKWLNAKMAEEEARQPVVPMNTCSTKSEIGVNGVLILGTCPACGYKWLRNSDNKFCSGCGRPVKWDE